MGHVKPVKDITFNSNREGFLFALSRRESSSDLRSPDNVSPNLKSQRVHNHGDTGYIGYFQFGEAALYDAGYFNVHHPFSTKIDSAFQKALKVQNWIGYWTGKDGVTSKAKFLNGRKHQWKAINIMVDRHCNALRNRNVNEFYGKVINGVEITESGCVAGCHLKGAKHVLDFVKGKANAADAFGTKVGEYIKLLAHYDLESCCSRKIYINVVKDEQPVQDYVVQVESEYREGKYFNEVGVIKNQYKTDENGKIPVIIRHPNAKIKVSIDGKSMDIVQQSDKKQIYTIDLSDNVLVRAPLQKPATPQPKPEPEQTPQEARNAQNELQAENQSTTSQSQDVRFNVQIVEGDSQKAISNMRFYLTYKGNIKEHRSDANGTKAGINAESGQDIEVAVSGNGAHQVVHHFTVQSGMEGQTIKVPLPVHSFQLKVINDSEQLVKNSTFMIFYRGRKITKKTNAQGMIQLKMLTGFVYGFGLINGKELVKVRCVNSIAQQGIKINAAAQKASKLFDQLAVSKPIVKPRSPVTQPTPSSSSKSTSPPAASRKPPVTQQRNTHTQRNGNPITTVSKSSPTSSDTTRYHIYHNGKIKRENKAATGFAEFIYYDRNGVKHNIGKTPYIPAPTRGGGNRAIGGITYLVDQRTLNKYKSKDGKIGYEWDIYLENRERYYLRGDAFASVIGALCSLGYNYYHGSGFSVRDGRSVGSSSHINGVNGDFRYLGLNGVHKNGPVYVSYIDKFDWDANVKFVNALYAFGYKSFGSQVMVRRGKPNKILPHVTFTNSDHDNHLHLQGFKPNIEDI